MQAARRLGWTTSLCLGIGLCSATTQAAEPVPIRAPEGFVVEEFAGDDLAHDIYAMTVDTLGRPVVSGRGYVKILVDDDKDGRADRAIPFADGPATGAQGLFFHGRALLCVGDAGLLRYRDDNADDRADGPADVFLRFKTGGEHDTHTIQQGPDGWWYVLGGNTAEISETYNTLPTAPVKYPRYGALARFRPDLTAGEIVADGMRNAYDFTFNEAGDLFTFDSDDEREISLPWYQPTRVFHMLIGSDHGWISRSWKRPAGFLDLPPVVADLGRGSPTGVICYRHTQFPEKYRGAIFALDWTYGRVFALPLTPSGATWKTEPEVFLTSSGDQGFAPTDVEVGADGSLFVCVGGRGTRGGVYRIRAIDGAKTDKPTDAPQDTLTKCLTAPQPLSAWSRHAWRPLAREIGADGFRNAALETARPTSQRVRAIEILTEFYGGLSESDLRTLQADPAPLIRARAIWSHGRSNPAKTNLELVNMYLLDREPRVVMAGLEAITGLSGTTPCGPIVPGLAKALGSSDPAVRNLAAAAVTRIDAASLQPLSDATSKLGARAVTTYAAGWLMRAADDDSRIKGSIPPLALALVAGKYPLDIRLDAVRLLQWVLGDMGPSEGVPPAFDGYTGAVDLAAFDRELDLPRIRLAEIYPTGDASLDREIARLLAMLQPPNASLLDKVLAFITPESEPLDDIHHLIVVARIPVPRSSKQTAIIAAGLTGLEGKLAARKMVQDSGWNDRMKEIYAALAKHDPMLAVEIVGQPTFGQAGHVMFLSELPGEHLDAAIAAFAKAAADEDYVWTNDVVFVVGESENPDHMQLLRDQYENFAVRGAVLMTLSADPEESDRAWYVEGLESSQAEVLGACLGALEELQPASTPEEFGRLLITFRRLGQDETEFKSRERVNALLERAAGQKSRFIAGEAGHRPQPEVIAQWTALLRQKWPKEADTVLGENSDELQKLASRLPKIDWTTGDVVRGKAVFQKRQCANCHGGRSALGPDLAGVAGRFSRPDLFTAIVAPSRDVSARYQTTILETHAGKVYSGLIVYESVDGLLLRNATNQTFRIEGREIASKRKSPVSIMPTGLLKDLSDSDLADLDAYLRSLTATIAVRPEASPSE
ncbi:MAG: c-type cytochrome [Planctomycetaceae bacterium]|nr:c-type cytochrome [Planctomycetaceae bacterium]